MRATILRLCLSLCFLTFGVVMNAGCEGAAKVVCGNDYGDVGEECDGEDLNGANCASQGYTGGEPTCNSDCELEFDSCLGGCGNGQKENDEECDGADLGEQTCTELGFGRGSLSCGADCTFDDSDCETWPYGDLGELVVRAEGFSYQLMPRAEPYDYSSLVVEAGAVLELLPGDGSHGWVILAVDGDAIINGEIRAIFGEHSGPFATIIPDANGEQQVAGKTLAYTILQMEGGAGGDVHCHYAPIYDGKLQMAGNGGGGYGAGGNQGTDATEEKGGDGCSAKVHIPTIPSFEDVGAVPLGALVWGNDGVPGPSVSRGSGWLAGGAGSGGSRGRHGQGLLIIIRGNLTGSGHIIASGQDGGKGGQGGDATASYDGNCGGPGGGGGAGGSGGRVVLVVQGDYNFVNDPEVASGTGGLAGLGGIGDHQGAGGLPVNGTAGTDGEMGQTGRWQPEPWPDPDRALCEGLNADIQTFCY